MTAYKSPLPARRRFLNKATYGACATTALVSVPELWVKPVVQSIILPAHAQTTTDDSTTSCTDSITISGSTWSCADSSSFTTTTFGRSNGCIVVSDTETHTSYIAPAANQIIFGKDPTVNDTFIIHVDTDYELHSESQDCLQPSSISFHGSHLIFVEGSVYRVDYTGTRASAPSSITVSDIVVMPV